MRDELPPTQTNYNTQRLTCNDDDNDNDNYNNSSSNNNDDNDDDDDDDKRSLRGCKLPLELTTHADFTKRACIWNNLPPTVNLTSLTYGPREVTYERKNITRFYELVTRGNEL